MPQNFGSTPTTTTTLGLNQFPVSAGFVPGTANGALTSIQLGPSTTDGNGYTSAPVAVYLSGGTTSQMLGVVAIGGTTTVSVPGNSGVVVVRATPGGRLASAIVWGTGASQLNIYDNASQASGTILGAVPANAAVGSVYSFNAPSAVGIVANSVAGCCSVTICYY